MEKPFEVIETVQNGLNIILTTRQSKRRMCISHIIDVEQGEKLQGQLQSAAEFLEKYLLGTCIHCGEACFTGDELFQIEKEGLVHRCCLFEFVTDEKYMDVSFPLKKIAAAEQPHFLTDGWDEKLQSELFSVSIFNSWDTRITITIQESNFRKPKTYKFGYYETLSLMSEMEAAIVKIHSRRIDCCYHCGKPYYINDRLYELCNGKKIHKWCMPHFIHSPKSGGIKIPLILIENG